MKAGNDFTFDSNKLSVFGITMVKDNESQEVIFYQLKNGAPVRVITYTKNGTNKVWTEERPDMFNEKRNITFAIANGADTRRHRLSFFSEYFQRHVLRLLKNEPTTA